MTSKKKFVITALILYPPFIVIFTALTLYTLLEEKIIENVSLYNFLKVIDFTQWPQPLAIIFLFLAFVLTVIICSAELIMHCKLLKRAHKAAEKEKEWNEKNPTYSYTPVTITFDSSTNTGYVSGGYYQDRPINLHRLLQVLLYVVLIVLAPIIFPFDAILHLAKYNLDAEKGDEDDENDEIM